MIVHVLIATWITLIAVPSMAKNIDDDLIGRKELSQVVINGIGRAPLSDPKDAQARGMIQTGLEPLINEKVSCPEIVNHWALKYPSKANHTAYHDGIDLPAPSGTPILAVADGAVVAKYTTEESPKNIEIVLRHRPQDTGLPFWVYTQYTHLLKMPDFSIGQEVHMGQVIGLTSKTDLSCGDTMRYSSKKARRTAFHFAVLYSPYPEFMRSEKKLIPFDGYWMDPNALFRKTPPYDSIALQALPQQEKKTPIPYKMPTGTIVPSGTKVIWPYNCTTKE